jgi:hypothetical protein
MTRKTFIYATLDEDIHAHDESARSRYQSITRRQQTISTGIQWIMLIQLIMSLSILGLVLREVL